MQQWEESGALRSSGASSSMHSPSAKSSHEQGSGMKEGMKELLQGCLEVTAGVIFIVGSVCFLPEYTRDVNIFVAGCLLFIIGAAIYVGLSGFTLLHAISQKESRAKIYEHILFFVGSIIFVWGTILFWPHNAASHHYVEGLKEMSLVQYYDLMLPELEATILFIIGAAFFGLAAVINVLTATPEEEGDALHLGIQICNFVASLLFVIGSIPYLPPLKCTDYQVGVGAWCFIIGSVIFLFGGIGGLGRTWSRWGQKVMQSRRMCDEDREALVGLIPK